jgi:hypothetical protein
VAKQPVVRFTANFERNLDALAVEQIRRNLATKILVCMAASTKMRCLGRKQK